MHKHKYTYNDRLKSMIDDTAINQEEPNANLNANDEN